MAMNTHRQLGMTNTAGSKSTEKLSSGFRINRAGDDAAGLAISEKMRGQIRGLNQASRNAQDGISLIQTAEGALNESQAILQRMRELAVQSANDTNVSVDRGEIQKEMNQLSSEINRIANTTEFNTKKLLNGDLVGTGSGSLDVSATFTFAVGNDESGSTKLSIGGEEYTITFVGATAYDNADPAGVNAGTKTITINTGTTAPTEDQLSTKLIEAFQSMRGVDPSLSITEYSFAKNGTALQITANATGSYAGAAGKDTISFVSGRSVAISDQVEGTNGSGGAVSLQIGANNAQAMNVSINEMTASKLGVTGTAGGTANGVSSIADDGTVTPAGIGASFTAADVVTDGTSVAVTEAALDVSTHDKATKAIEVLDYAVKNVSAERSKLGAVQNRLEHTIKNLDTSSENLQASESRIRDVDMAKEMMEFTKNNILQQAAQAMLAQANSAPQGVLQLLR